MRQVAVGISVLFVSACGGSSSGPDPAPTTSGINVTVSSPLRMGQTTQAAGTAALSNGQTQPVTAGWRSDAPAVATVTEAGVVTGVANGRATIYVISGGVQGQQLIRVVPDYHGRWDGGLRVTACADSGVWASNDACDNFPVNGVSEHRVSFDQSGESMSAEVSYGGVLEFPAVTVPIGSDGRATFKASTTGVESGITYTIETTYAINSAQVGELTGTVNEVWRLPNISGEMRLAQDIVSTARTSATPSATSMSTRPTKFSVLQRFHR